MKTKNPPVAKQIEELQKQVENLTMAMRISQAMLQQVLPAVQNMSQDLEGMSGAITNQNYAINVLRQGLMRSVGGEIRNALSDEAFQASIEKLKVEDWTKASLDDDKTNGYIVAERVASPADIVMFTTKVVADPSKGIFRSKVQVSEFGNPDLMGAFIGKAAGDTFSVKLGDVEHEVLLLGVRSAPETQGE